MVADRTTDGVRIAQLLASELTGDRDVLADVGVSDADPDVEPTPEGALAYRVRMAVGNADPGEPAGTDRGDRPVAEVSVHPERVRVEFVAAPDAAAVAAADAGLRVRPKAVAPPRTVVFVEDGAQVKRVLPAFRAVVNSDPA